jgi:hypothetical protein
MYACVCGAHANTRAALRLTPPLVCVCSACVLRVFFCAGDVVRADVITGPDGRSKGFGIVKYSTAKGAEKAIDALNESDFEGRKLIVRLDHRRLQ